MHQGMKLLATRARPAVEEAPPPPRPASVSPDEVMRMTQQRLALSLESDPITKADLDMSAPLVPQIRHLLEQR
jgi:hypothetical protein